MAKLTRVTAKVFGETADATLADPQIGQFGSAKAGTYNGTNDVATIQALPAWSNGWADAVTPTQQFPALPERTGVDKVLSYQSAYLLQQGIPEWDNGTTYYINSFCSKNGKIYISETDGNIGNDPENSNTNWKEFTSGGARNIGEIVPSIIPLTDAGLHLLDGALINGSGIYSAFVDYIAGLVTDYPNLFTTEAAWQTSVTNYGNCGKFVYDSVNNTVRLPKITRILQGASDVSELGNRVEAGLPNITGTFNADTSYTVASGTGAFLPNPTANTNAVAAGHADGVGKTFSFNASRSSDVYGNSNTVQPQSIKVLYYIVITTSTKTDIQVDIDEIATDLNGKADTDLSNVPSSKGILTKSYVNGTSWYRVYSDGWCEQGGLNAKGNTSITLLKSYKDTNYSIYYSPDYGGGSPTWAELTGGNVNNNNRTVSGFRVGTRVGNWETKGYIK